MSIPLHVLLLEDVPADAELILGELRRNGFAPTFKRVETRAEYLAELEQPYDLIISDHTLPQFDGLSALRLLSQSGRDVPFLLVTGAVGEDIAVSVMREGAADYLMKDRLTRLGQAVTHALEQKKLRDAKKRSAQALHQKVETLRTLAEIDREIIAADDVQGILDLVCERAAILLHAPKAVIAYRDGRAMHMGATFGLQDAEAAKRELAQYWDTGRMPREQTQSQPIAVSHIGEHAPHMSELRKREGIQALVFVPFGKGTGTQGILTVFDTRPHDWGSDEVEILSLLAGQTAIALEKARLFEVEQTHRRELTALYALSRQLAATDDLTQLHAVAVRHAVETVRVTFGSIVLLEGESLVVRAAYPVRNLQRDISRGFRGALAEHPACQRALAQNSPLVLGRDDPEVTDAERESLFLGIAQSVCLVPLQVGDVSAGTGQSLGLLLLGEERNAKREPFTGEKIKLAQSTGEQIATALQRATLHAQTRRRADQLAAVNTLGRALAEVLEPQQIHERLSRATFQLLPDISTIIISFVDPEGPARSCAFGRHDGAPLRLDAWPALPFLPPGQNPTNQVISTQRPLIVNDVARASGADNIVHDAPTLSPRSAVFVPMLGRGDVVGVIEVRSHLPGRFSQEEADLLVLVANTAAVAIENARLFAETERHLRHVQALHAIDVAITSSMDLSVTLNILLAQAASQLRADACEVLMFNPYSQTLEYAAARGFRTRPSVGSHLRVGQGFAGQAALDRRLVSVSDLSSVDAANAHVGIQAGEGFRAYHAMPLIAKGEVKGVLGIFHRTLFEADREWQDLLQALAAQAAIAIDNAQLFEALQHSHSELSLSYQATIEGWSRAVDLHDHETTDHTERVTQLTLRLARAAGLGEEELAHIQRGAMLHDIGKFGIPDAILFKPGPLTEAEWEIMRRHPEIARDLMIPIDYLRPAIDIPYCHHEKWDGTGYPRGLSGELIPLSARLFAVVDVWDSLQSVRPCRGALSAEQVVEYLRHQAGKHFDPKVVDEFLRLLETPRG